MLGFLRRWIVAVGGLTRRQRNRRDDSLWAITRACGRAMILVEPLTPEKDFRAR